ncbi:unnamed protein product [Adineta steineri]|uniref:Uncharacterized protein n=1 Tax=Adineta steineri TaxID=433720 RepID=A0A816FAN0_9BILA|nr:unnamed protein product [Adineta steineri]CAF1657582.1 unnamed protein product [Adineta steineri]
MKDGCSCGTQRDCIDSGGIHYSLNNIKVSEVFAIPRWNIECSVVETLLQSTFKCLYNQTYIDLLLYYATSVYDQYTNTLIQTIADELFIEEWKTNSYYSSFYNQCAPDYCSYKTQKDDYAIYIISQVLDLYGGFTVSLRYIISIITKIIFNNIKRCQNNRIIPNE